MQRKCSLQWERQIYFLKLFCVPSGPAAITVVDDDSNLDLAVTIGRSNVVNVLLGGR